MEPKLTKLNTMICSNAPCLTDYITPNLTGGIARWFLDLFQKIFSVLTWFAGELQTTEWRRNQARPQPSVAATKAFGTWHQADTFLAFQYFNPRYSFNLFDLTFDFLQSLYSLSSTMQLHLLQHGLSVASIIISERSENRDKVGIKIFLLC